MRHRRKLAGTVIDPRYSKNQASCSYEDDPSDSKVVARMWVIGIVSEEISQDAETENRDVSGDKAKTKFTLEANSKKRKGQCVM